MKQKNDHIKTLVLDSAYKPLGTISWKRAFNLIYRLKAEVVEEYKNNCISTISKTFKIPSVIRVLNFISKHKFIMKFSREAVYQRDKQKCQYCGIPLSRSQFTLDHVIPRSKGGKSTFENVVVCCKICNENKQDLLPQEAGMKLKTKPYNPDNIAFRLLWNQEMPSEWKMFVYG